MFRRRFYAAFAVFCFGDMMPFKLKHFLQDKAINLIIFHHQDVDWAEMIGEPRQIQRRFQSWQMRFESDTEQKC